MLLSISKVNGIAAMNMKSGTFMLKNDSPKRVNENQMVLIASLN